MSYIKAKNILKGALLSAALFTFIPAMPAFAQSTCSTEVRDAKLCLGSGGTFNTETQVCTCPTDTSTPPPTSGTTGGTGATGGTDTSTPPPNSGSSGSACPAHTTRSSGGLCIPDNPFTGGLAQETTITGLITAVVKILLTLAGVAAVVLIIVGGYQYMTSAGNAEQAEKGQKTLTSAIIGLVLIVLAYAIVTIVVNLLTNELVT